MANRKACYGSNKAFAADMKKLVNNPLLSDVQFVVGEERKQVFGHKAILSPRCEVFKAMFAQASDSKPKMENGAHVFVLSDTQPHIFLAVIEFIYTNRCYLDACNVTDVLTAAVEYGIEDLKKLCIDFFKSTLTVDTVCEALQAAISYNNSDLKKTCLGFVERNTLGVFKSRTFVEMSEESLSYVLQSDKLKADESEVLNAVKEWSTVNAVITGQSMKDVARKVINHVRFSLLDPEYLNLVEKENELKPFIPIRLLSEAWRSHALQDKDSNNPQLRARAGTLPHDALARKLARSQGCSNED